MNISPLTSAMGLSGIQGAQTYQPTGGAQFSFKLPEAPKHIAPTIDPSSATQVDKITEPTSWGQMMQRMAMDVNSAQTSADSKIRDVVSGGNTPVHEAMIAMQESNVKFMMLSEVKNKMVEAYHEIMRMQV